MAARQKTKALARTIRRPASGVGLVLEEVRRHLCISEQPAKDAGKIIRMADKIRTIHTSKRGSTTSRSKEASPMLKEGTKRASKPKAEAPTLQELIDRVVDNPEAWLSTPNVQFGGREPRQLVGTREETKLINLLRAVDQGLF